MTPCDVGVGLMSNDRGLPQPPTRSSPGTFSGLPQTLSQCPQTPTSPRFCGPWTLPTPKPTEPSCHRHPRDPLLVRAQPCQGPEELRSLQRQGGRAGGDPSSPASGRPPLTSLGLECTHRLLWPLLGSLGVHLQGGKLGGALLPGLGTGSVRPSSPPLFPLQQT